MNNYDVAHQFFYDLSGNFSKNYLNVSYKNYKFYSYYTCIGKVVEDLNGNYLLLVSENNFSNTTGKHINNLIGACPINNRLFVPVNYGDSDININELENRIIEKLELYKKSKLSLKNNREEYCRYYTMLCEISHKIVKVKKSIIAKYRKLYIELQDIEKVKELKKKQRIQDKKEDEKAKIEKQKQENKIKVLCKKFDINNLQDYINVVYNKNHKYDKLEEYANINYLSCMQVVNLIKDINKYLLDNYKNIDFIWIEDGFFKTSKHVTIKIEDCKSLIRLYKSGKIKHGMQLNQYTILEVKNDYVKIGCHKILRENLDILLKEF